MCSYVCVCVRACVRACVPVCVFGSDLLFPVAVKPSHHNGLLAEKTHCMASEPITDTVSSLTTHSIGSDCDSEGRKKAKRRNKERKAGRKDGRKGEIKEGTKDYRKEGIKERSNTGKEGRKK